MQKYSFQIFITLLTLSVLYMLKGFIMPVVLGAIGAVVLYHPTRVVNQKLKSYKVSVFITIVACALLFFLPLTFLLFSGITEIIQAIQQGQFISYVSDMTALSEAYLPKFKTYFPLSGDSMKGYLSQGMQYGGAKALAILQGIVLNFPKLLMDLGITILSAYIFLIEKDKMKALILGNKIFNPQQTEKIYKAVLNATNSVVISSLVSGLLQGIIMAIVASIIIPSKILLIGILTFMFSFVPVVGTAPITLTLLLINWVQADYTAIVVILIGVGFLTLVDNVLKPYMIGSKIQIHPLLAFLSALGGLSLFGFYGLFLGPILVGILFSLLKNN